MATLAFAHPAAAQVRATATLASDDRFRGRSVSEGRPVATLDVSYDLRNGAYFGLAATGVAARHDGPRLLAVQEYAGYVARLASGPSLDVGVTHAKYTDYYSGEVGADYSEAYVGLITERLVARLFFSPNYFGRRDKTLYGEVETSAHATRNWRVTAHAGVLAVLSGPRTATYRPAQYDWRLGVARRLGGFNLELDWSGAGPDRDNYAGAARARSGVVAAVRRAF